MFFKTTLFNAASSVAPHAACRRMLCRRMLGLNAGLWQRLHWHTVFIGKSDALTTWLDLTQGISHSYPFLVLCPSKSDILEVSMY
jgi:hypothetical protein